MDNNFEKLKRKEDEYILDSSSRLESFTLQVPSSKDTEQFKEKIIEMFNSYGAVVVEFEENEESSEQLLCFKKIFGNTLSHDRADENMIAEIAISEKFQGYLGTSNSEHPFHTDGAYDDNPPLVTALRCETPAKRGGETRIVSGKAIYDYLTFKNKDALEALFASDALCVERAGKKSCQPVFRREGGRIFIRYRSDDTSTPSDNIFVQEAMAEIKKFLENDKNYLAFILKRKQVLITDNTRLLHARTAFPKDDPRKMHRLFFKGDLRDTSGPVFGFSGL
jgi:alpha-ketoglutarate-dependent taurine dioxygenase